MTLIRYKFDKIGLAAPRIMMPSEDVSLAKWAVIACDQYTSDPSYWEDVDKTVGQSPSALRMFLPEAYLGTSFERKGASSILREMKSYIKGGVLCELEPGFMLTRRTTSYGNVRNGLIVCVDLEEYSFEPGSQPLIRPTEKTILERIPPRVRIREKAPLELPHILFLIDDPGKTVIEPLVKSRNLYTKLYDFNLMKNGGRIEGYHITEESALSSIANSIITLASKDNFRNRYGADRDLMLYAVGDGNHSLAAALQHWTNVKARLGLDSSDEHPARYAMVELINLHDEGMKFEAIHRVLFGCSADDAIAGLKASFDVEIKETDGLAELLGLMNETSTDPDLHGFGMVSGGRMFFAGIKSPVHSLTVATVQEFLDGFSDSRSLAMDFIHDTDSAVALSKSGNIAFLLPPINKAGFFRTVIEEGTLPRKAFSMGHADEKRFYLESRRII
ncbi:MAG: DUF1015 domain-containing protein [Clostridia bacterium]